MGKCASRIFQLSTLNQQLSTFFQMSIQSSIRLAIHIIIAWATVFASSYHDGMTSAQIAILIAAMLIAGGDKALAYLSDPSAATFPKISRVAGAAAVVTLCFLLCSCAGTEFRAGGKPVAKFQGDMAGQSFHYADSTTTIDWTCQSVSHSAATLAQGQAADQVLGGVATAASGVGTGVALSGALPGGLTSLIHP